MYYYTVLRLYEPSQPTQRTRITLESPRTSGGKDESARATAEPEETVNDDVKTDNERRKPKYRLN